MSWLRCYAAVAGNIHIPGMNTNTTMIIQKHMHMRMNMNTNMTTTMITKGMTMKDTITKRMNMTMDTNMQPEKLCSRKPMQRQSV